MKYLILLLSIASLSSCVKKIDVLHDIHDTLYLSRLQIDTFHTISIFRDTVVVHDNHTDTLLQVKHDTLIITTIKHDTLFKSFLDTVYLTKNFHDTVVTVKTVVTHDTIIQQHIIQVHDTTLKTVVVQVHDTIPKLVYLHDTINNFEKIFIHDTVVKITTIIHTDTVTQYLPQQNPYNYPVPAIDTQLLYVYLDTVPGLVINSIKFQNVYTFSSPPGAFSQEANFTSFDTTNISYRYGVRTLTVPGPMICIITIDYDRAAGTYLTFEMHTFLGNPGVYSEWITHSPNGFGGAPGDVFHHETAQFQYVNLPNVFQLNISNH